MQGTREGKPGSSGYGELNKTDENNKSLRTEKNKSRISKNEGKKINDKIAKDGVKNENETDSEHYNNPEELSENELSSANCEYKESSGGSIDQTEGHEMKKSDKENNDELVIEVSSDSQEEGIKQEDVKISGTGNNDEKKDKINMQESELEDFFDFIGLDRTTPFSEKELEEYERDLEFENKKPKDRIWYVPANRFSNFNYHSVLCTYVPFTVDLSNMGLQSFDGIEFLSFVSYINASNNLIMDRGLQYLAEIDDLIVLILEKNNLSALIFPPLENLMLLDVSNNEVAWIHNDFKLLKLETLILDYNMLPDVSKLGRESVPNLRFLSLKCNYIKELEVNWPKYLIHLYLGENMISDPKGLTGLCNLKTLHLRKNKLDSLKEFPKDLLSLEYLNLRENAIKDGSEMKRLRNLTNLKTLIIMNNPCTYQGENDESYRMVVLSYLLFLQRLDKMKVNLEELERARQLQRIFRDDELDKWAYAFHYNEEGEGEIEIEVESPDTFVN